ncbi:exodeoxyribonuclease VII large subunit [Aquiflexum gelatinilyticum]|uniref:Exodeoxyribonuclease 7 large subunit n=1 Tax=Aquiflexum gelatinilyticum TaxID=2961943 RepID=A0A9X2P3R9_9BACT|nr:exodeoxyribonuclease VII large subunit [Aquiflexum gelatinilyticum]MCR9015371.1 exodeoxyribonuclease VII large subunit [Aquiflexum gelatinilyticum]
MQQAISLLALNQLIRETLDVHLEPSYWIVAEIGELKQAGQGHAYLDLVEKQGNQIAAKMRANIWAYSYRTIAGRFQATTGQSLRAGMKILAQVTVTFHELYGISLNIKDIDPNFTLGERARIRQEIINRLSKEGMIELNKRYALPTVPQKIAVISSSTAAGYGDFVNQIEQNRFGYKVWYKLYQATLQGTDAAATLISAFQRIEADQNLEKFDVIVLIRGGGAQLDLDCFDDYGLAMAIAKSPLPVLTGIGHERDETIADLVSHTKMKTPTAVAEFILSGFRDFEDSLNLWTKNLSRFAGQMLVQEDKKTTELENRLKNLVRFNLSKNIEKLTFYQNRIKSSYHNQIKFSALSLINLNKNLIKSWKVFIEKENRNLELLEKDLNKSDPNTFFEKGYTRSEINGIPIHKSSPKIGQEMLTFSKNIILSSTINEIKDYGK